MKLTFLLFFTFVVATMGLEYEGAVEGIANVLEMTKDEVRACFNEKNITQEDLMKFDRTTVDNLQATDAQDINLKVGCMFACLGQKKEIMTGAHFNLDKYKELIQERLQIFGTEHGPEKLARMKQQIDSCANQVKTITDECRVALTFTRCMNE